MPKVPEPSEPRLRILPERRDDGPGCMALDEALLEAAEGPTARLYAWSQPTVSLGYFQEHDPIRAAVAARRSPPPPLVRRITGGGAIWHEHEVTYCLVGRLGRDGFPGTAKDLYPLLHGAVRAALARSGAALERQAASVGDRRYRDEPRCFASPAADDLTVAGGGKTLGSAARQRGERILVHGSLKLASNPWDGETVAGCGLDPATAGAALLDGITTALGLQRHPGDVTAAEQAACARIRAERYGSDDWVVRRIGPRG